jgi:hypothetical protein
MLWSLPLRAHAPIVAGRNLTFAASRISAASASVIQSEAERGIAQSAVGPAGAGLELPPSFAAPPSLPLDPSLLPESDDLPESLELSDDDSLDDDSLDDDSLDDDEEDEDDDFRAELELRSFFAQPVPLKWMLGALNALRIVVAPQLGHRSGPASFTPWMTSNRRPQVEQT